MKKPTLAELISPDVRVKYAGPFGAIDDPGMRAEAYLGALWRAISNSDLDPAVPEHVAARFERLRMLYFYGCFKYEFFTVVVESIYSILEAALGARLIEHYRQGVPLVKPKTGASHLNPSTSFDGVADAFRRGWRLQGHPSVNGNLHGLLTWARREGLLSGQRNDVVEYAKRGFRNAAAHPHRPLLVDRGDSGRSIRDVAELINHHWAVIRPAGGSMGPRSRPSFGSCSWHPTARVQSTTRGT